MSSMSTNEAKKTFKICNKTSGIIAWYYSKANNQDTKWRYYNIVIVNSEQAVAQDF